MKKDYNLDRIKETIKPKINKWFYRWSFKFIKGELHFWRNDLPTFTSCTMSKEAFIEKDFEKDAESLVFYINWLNKKYPIKTHSSNRKKIMERRKWINRYKRYGR